MPPFIYLFYIRLVVYKPAVHKTKGRARLNGRSVLRDHSAIVSILGVVDCCWP
jgi:hypothetical protein